MTNSSGRIPRAIVAGHGTVAEGLVSAVQAIAGLGDVFVPMSNRDHSGETLMLAMRNALDQHALQVIFTDLPAGSATLAARKLQRERASLVVICGVNLAALLEFAMHDGEDAGAAAIAAAERGRQSLTVAPGVVRAT